MINPENNRLLADERAALEAETALVREEQKLWQRLEAALGDANDKRTQPLVARLAALEASPDAPAADIARARGIVMAGSHPDPVVAQSERSAALSARRGALSARELAVKALHSALQAVETAKVVRAKELELAESLLAGAESGQKKASEDRRRAEEAAKKAQADAAEAARRAQAAAAVIETRTEPNMRAVPAAASPASMKTDPGYPVAFDATKTEPGGVPMPVVAAPAPAAKAREPAKTEALNLNTLKQEPPKAAKTAKAQAPATATPTGTAPAKKVSRRRRVKLAPPPRRLDVEVAVYGDNNFYTGFDNDIAAGGLFVASLETLPPGHEIDLEISVEGKKIATRGRVEFLRTDNMANPECTQGAGFRLSNLSRENVAAIQAFFQVRQPMFFVQP